MSAAEDAFTPGSSFRRARWHHRGWTLQELLAPSELEFYDRDWRYIFGLDRRRNASKAWREMPPSKYIDALLRDRRDPEEHVRLLAEITRISEDVLRTGDMSDTCVAARLAWAAPRTTTRVEDTAYCLLGLLGVNMPLLYGEGDRAFLRLQQEIIDGRDDNSLLAYGYDLLLSRRADRGYNSRDILAQSPAAFGLCRDFRRLPRHHAENLWRLAGGPFPSTMTNVGLQIVLPILKIDPQHRVALALLDYTPDKDHLVVVPLVYSGHISKGHFYRALGSLPFLIHASLLYNPSPRTGPLALLLPRRKARPKPKAMQVLLRGYDAAEESISSAGTGSILRWPPLRWPPTTTAKKRPPFVVDFDDVIKIADCRLVSFYPPWVGSERSELNWSVRLDEGVAWCFLIFRASGRTFGVSIRPRSIESTDGVVGGFGEVELTATVEHLVNTRTSGLHRAATAAGAAAAVSFPRFQSPRMELEIPEMPHIKHVLSFREDDVFKNWLNITCRAEACKNVT